jgi:hypothetical protein
VPDIPTGVGWAILVCVVAMIVERRRPADDSAPVIAAPKASPATMRTVGLLVATVVYVLAMQYGVSFVWATVVFILCGGFLLSQHKRSHALILVETSLLVAFGVQFVLTKIVVTDLP